MNILWLNLATVFTCSFFARYFATNVSNDISASKLRPNLILTFIALLSLVVISGLRANIGDTPAYKFTYEINDFTWDEIKDEENIGFWIYQKILKNFSDDPQTLIFTTALITNILIILVLAKYSRMFELSTYVYITGGLYLVSMNGIRQVLTAAIIFAATKFLIEGKWQIYLGVVLLASTIHESALVLIPIYFIVRFKSWSKATFYLLFFSILIVIGFDKFSSVLFASIENSQYGHYKDFAEGGANIIRVAVNAAPLVLAFLGRDKLRRIFPQSDYIVNMSLIGLAFMIVSTQNWIFARFSIYFSLYQLILVSWLVVLFNKKEQKFVYYSILVCYFLYYYYENVISLNIIYKSDYF